MNNDANAQSADDEIDLRELFMVLWAFKTFIACVCAVSIVIAGYYALNANKEFTSTAVFNLDNNQSSGLSLGGDLGALANLAGLSSGASTSTLPEEQINGRIFIKKIDKKLDFQADPYFNNYNPKSIDPIWKSTIKRAIGWQTSTIDVQEAIWQGISNTYLQNVALSTTDGGSLKIKVTHANAGRAAEIANRIMQEIISDIKKKKDHQQDSQLAYLSNTLAGALSDLEIAQSSLKVFALESSALPLESFAAGSLQLDALRDQLRRTTELQGAIADLSQLLNDGATNQSDYQLLRQRFPIVDQVEFRRVMGQNEIISSWSWPEVGSVAAVLDTLSERKSRLQSQVDASQIDAERSGRTLENYARLEREAKIAEATYTVLIEQVKAQSMMAGYRPSKSEIYEYASPSISPSAPKRSLILALGAVLGLFLGSALALILAFQRGVYYSRKSLIANTQARFNESSRSLTSLRNKTLNEMDKLIEKRPRPMLRDIAVEIHKSCSAQAVVTSSRAKITASAAAQALALTMQSEDTKIAVIDFSAKSRKLATDTEQMSVGSFVIAACEVNVSVLRPQGTLTAVELISQKDFLKNIKSLNSKFDVVFLCADNGDAVSLLRALEGEKMFHLTLARTRHTKSDALLSMRSLLPIQGLLHD